MIYKAKLIVGYRRDQEHSIDAEEVHKAYFLFLNPEQRGVFNNGLAIVGSQIQEIVPDYQGTMGWNPTHVLDGNDWNELYKKGITNKMLAYLTLGKRVAQLGKPEDFAKPISQIEALGPSLNAPRPGGVKSIQDFME